MNDMNMQAIWKSYPELEVVNKKYSVDDIRRFRESHSNKSSLATNRLLLFDCGYKLLVISGYFIILLLGSLTIIKFGISVLVIIIILALIARNFLLRQRLNQIDESAGVLQVLKLKYVFLSQFYREFLFITSLTHPFFVLIGFQFYQFFKYGSDRIETLMADPVTYVFLVLAFVIPFIAQRVEYAEQLDNLELLLDDATIEMDPGIGIMKMRSRKRARAILYSTLILLGLLLLLLVIHLVI